MAGRWSGVKPPSTFLVDNPSNGSLRYAEPNGEFLPAMRSCERPHLLRVNVNGASMFFASRVETATLLLHIAEVLTGRSPKQMLYLAAQRGIARMTGVDRGRMRLRRQREDEAMRVVPHAAIHEAAIALVANWSLP